MDAETKLKITIGELVLNQIKLTSQIENLQDEVKKLEEKVKDNGTNTSN